MSRNRMSKIGDPIRKRLLLLCALSVVGMMLFSGCQLALPDGEGTYPGTGANRDRLIGVYVTREHLDLFDMESYLQDNLQEVLSDGDHVIREGEAYEGRLYAALVTRSATDENGHVMEHQEYVFEELEGMALYVPCIDSEEGRYYSSISGQGISDVHVGYHTRDTGEDITLDGIIYVSAGSSSVQQGNMVFYFNPVYQTAEGQVYLRSGSGLGGTSVGGEGSGMSHNINDSVTVTENGEEKTYACDVTVTVESVFAPEKVVVMQMSTENHVLTQTEYIPGQLPESMTPETETAYLLVEAWKRDEKGQWIVTRSLCQREDRQITVLYDRGDGICEEDVLSVMWPES